MAGAAIFDVDGTLTDTNHLHVVAWWEAFRQAGHTVPMPDILRSVGLGSGDLIERLLGEDRDREQDDSIGSAHTVLYGTYFDRIPAFRGAGKLLRTLDGRGWRVVLATSAGGAELAALRRAIDADEAILATASSDDVEQGKPARSRWSWPAVWRASIRATRCSWATRCGTWRRRPGRGRRGGPPVGRHSARRSGAGGGARGSTGTSRSCSTVSTAAPSALAAALNPVRTERLIATSRPAETAGVRPSPVRRRFQRPAWTGGYGRPAWTGWAVGRASGWQAGTPSGRGRDTSEVPFRPSSGLVRLCPGMGLFVLRTGGTPAGIPGGAPFPLGAPTGDQRHRRYAVEE
ncbi:Phosphoglycolate phosphatase [Streptomyces californicus]